MPWLTTEGSSIFPIIFAVAFLILSLAVGRRMLIILGARGAAAPIEYGVIAAGLGAGALQFIPFMLGALGCLSTTSIQIATGVIVLIAATDLRAVSIALIAAVRRSSRPSSWTLAWLVALSPALLMAGLVALAPTLDPDGLTYHLTVPKRWMSTGGLDYLPTYPYSNAPMGAEMLFALGMAFAGDVAAKCIHYVLGVLAGAAIYLAGRRLSGQMVGAVPATLFLVGPGGAAVILGCAYVEGAASLATAGAALAWLIWYQTNNRGYLRSAAVLSGIAVSFKITSALFPIALLALTASVVAIKAQDEQSENATGRGSSVYLGIVAAVSLIPFMAAPVLPWFTRAFLITGNPIYPLLARFIPSLDLSPDLAAKYDQYNRYMAWANSIGRDWTLQQRVWVVYAIAAVCAVLGALAFVMIRGGIARATVVVSTVTSLLQLSAAGLYLRYWLPLSAALMLPIAAALNPILSKRPVVWAWLGVTLACSILQTYRTNIDEGSNFIGLVRTVAGFDRRSDFLRSRLGLYSLYETANRDLPADAGIMLASYCGGFYIDRRTFCLQMVQTSIRFTTWQQFTEDLRRLHVTHLIAPSALATGGSAPNLLFGLSDYAQDRLITQLLRSHARTIATASDQSLYEITLAPADTL